MSVVKFPRTQTRPTPENVLRHVLEDLLPSGGAEKVIVVRVDSDGVTHTLFSDEILAGEIAAAALMLQVDAVNIMTGTEEGGE